MYADGTIGPTFTGVITRDGQNLDPDGYTELCGFLRDPHVDLSRGLVRIAPELLQVLWELQTSISADAQRYYRDPNYVVPIVVHSCYRTSATNEETAGHATQSMHVAGAAADFHMPGVRITAIRDRLLNGASNGGRLPLVGGVGTYSYPKHDKRGRVVLSTLDQGWIHADVGPPREWTG